MKKLVSAVLAVGFLFALSIAAQAQVSATDLNGIKISGTANVTFLGYQSSYNNKGVKKWDEEGGRWFYNPGDPYDTDLAWQEGAWVDDSSRYETDVTQSKEQAEFRIELFFDKTFSNGGSARLRLRGGANDNGTAALGQFRGAVNDQNFGNGDDQIFVKEIYYTQPFEFAVIGKSSIRIGKIGTPTSGNNVGSLSVGSFFTDDATADGAQAGDQNPYGLQLDLNPIPLLGITYAYLTQDHLGIEQNFSEGSYHVLILTFKPIAAGNWRFGYWYSDKRYQVAELYSEETSPGSDEYRYYRNDGGGDRSLWKENPTGFFLSIDQKIPDLDVTPFARFGKRLDRTDYASKAGQDLQIGAKIGGSFWGRDKDHVFIAFGIAWYQTDVINESNRIAGNKAITGEKRRADGSFEEYITEDIKPENHFEVNYSYTVNEGVSIIPFVQYVWDIYRRGGYILRPDYVKRSYSVVDASGYAAGIRTQIKF